MGLLSYSPAEPPGRAERGEKQRKNPKTVRYRTKIHHFSLKSVSHTHDKLFREYDNWGNIILNPGRAAE
jgi:hypothetical protein